MMIRFLDGRSEEAILLSGAGDRLRVALRDCEDSAEFRFQDGVWLSEGNAPAQIELAPASAFGPVSDWVN